MIARLIMVVLTRMIYPDTTNFIPRVETLLALFPVA